MCTELILICYLIINYIFYTKSDAMFINMVAWQQVGHVTGCRRSFQSFSVQNIYANSSEEAQHCLRA